GFEDAVDVAARSVGGDVGADRDCRQGLPQPPVQRRQRGAAGGLVGRPQIVAAQRLARLVARPAEPVGAAAAGIDREIRHRRIDAGAARSRMKQVPAALVRRLLLGAAGDQGSPITVGDLDIDAELLEIVGRDIAERADAGDLVGVDQRDLLALVAGLAEQRLGTGQILLLIRLRACLGLVRAAADKERIAGAPQRSSPNAALRYSSWLTAIASACRAFGLSNGG